MASSVSLCTMVRTPRHQAALLPHNSMLLCADVSPLECTALSESPGDRVPLRSHSLLPLLIKVKEKGTCIYTMRCYPWAACVWPAYCLPPVCVPLVCLRVLQPISLCSMPVCCLARSACIAHMLSMCSMCSCVCKLLDGSVCAAHAQYVCNSVGASCAPLGCPACRVLATEFAADYFAEAGSGCERMDEDPPYASGCGAGLAHMIAAFALLDALLSHASTAQQQSRCN